MDETTNRIIKKFEIETKHWRFSDLSKQLYKWFDLFNKHFFQKKLKTPVISFDRTRSNTLGHFVVGRNSIGLKWNTNINSLYIDLPLVDTLATLLHEMTHQWQQEFGKKKGKSRRSYYHNLEFRNKTKRMGIPSDKSGVTSYYKNPFISFLKDNGVSINSQLLSEKQPAVMKIPAVKKIPGMSKLKKWCCGCTNVRVAISDFQAKCLKCSNKFVLVSQ